jgi:hypothetical protein
VVQNDVIIIFLSVAYIDIHRLGFKKALFGGAMTYVLGSYLIIMWEDKSWTDEQLISS